MSRMRTHKKQVTIISNDSIQGCKLSLEGIGLLAICLSMPPTWEFSPKQMWKKGYCSRDKLYRVFNELIEAGHCIRIFHPNPKAHNLPGEIEYEIFDDISDCERRCEEIHKMTSLYLQCSMKFKKFYRHPKKQDTKTQAPKTQAIYKETEDKETPYKETPPPLAPPKPKPEPKKEPLRGKEDGSLRSYPILDETTLSPKDKMRLTKEHSKADVERAVKLSKTIPIKKSLMGLLLDILNNPDSYPTETTEIKPLTQKQQLALQYNHILAKTYPRLAKENEERIMQNHMRIVTDNTGDIEQISLNSYDFEIDLAKAKKLLE